MMGGVYDWSQMPLKPSSPTTAQRQAIGKLAYDCGVAVNMQYTSNSSGAYMRDLRSAFSEVFGYEEAQYKTVNYDLTPFFNIVQSELAQRRPVAISILGDGKHCVVLDGYGAQSDVDYYHLNMGWGGQEDLWYNLPNAGYYNVVCEVVYGIRPSAEDWVDPLSEGVDNFDLHFTTGGDADWYLQTSTTHDGEDALRTGKIGNSKSTWLQTQVDGSGILTFWWKCDTGNALWGSDDYKFQLDGTTKSTIHGSESWTKKTYRIKAPGTHILRWIYIKDSSGAAIERADCGWLDEVTWTPMVTVTLDANGGTVSSNELFLVKGGQCGILPEPTREGFTFKGWYTALQGGQKITSSSILTGDILLTAQWLRDETTFYDWDSWMTFATWGKQTWSNVWAYDTLYTRDGGYYAFRSGAIDHQQESSLGLTVEGKGFLTFYQRISSEEGYDKLSLTIDGEQKYSISGEIAYWDYYCEILGAGTHEIVWTYAKDKAKVGGDDCAWLDCIEWHPLLTITLDANGGNFNLNRQTYDTTGYERMGCYLVSARVPEREGYVFNGWFTDPTEGQVITKDTLLTRDLTRWYAHWVKKTDLNDALDTDLEIVTGGDSPWFGQEEQTFDTIDAAQSGFISRTGESWLEVVTDGAGYLSFKWAIDGGYSYYGSAYNDVLGYWRDGCKVDSVEGTRGWESCEFWLPEGVHTNRWMFERHSSDSLANRRAWLDQLEWHPQMQVSFWDCLAENEDPIQTTTCYEGFPVEWGSVPVLTRENYIFQGWYSAPEGGELLTDGAVYDRMKSNWYAHWIPDIGMVEKFAGVGFVEYGGQGWKVTLTNEVDGPIEIPDNLGKVTIDLMGMDLQGEHGTEGNENMSGGNGLPAIRIVHSDEDGEPTELTIVNSGKTGGAVAGGDGGAGCPPGNGAAAISVAGDAREGVIVNIGKDVEVSGGNGGKCASGIVGDRGKGAVGIEGNVGSNDGTISGGIDGYSDGVAEFIKAELTANENSNVVVRVWGGNLSRTSSVKVYLKYSGAAAPDLDLKKTLVNGAAVNAKKFKFPVTLKWAAGEVGEKTITLKTKKDSLAEGDELFTLQLGGELGVALGEQRVASVTIRDVGASNLKVSVKNPKKTKGVAKMQVEVFSADESAGMAVGTGWWYKGAKLTVKARAKTGYAFAGWYNVATGKKVSASASYTFTVKSDIMLEARFSKRYYVRALADPADGASVSGSGWFASGKVVTLKAKTASHFKFLGWYAAVAGDPNLPDMAVKLSGSATYKPVVTNDMTVYACYQSEPRLELFKTSGGTVKGANKYATGKTATLTAKPSKGYAFLGWFDAAGNRVSQATTYKYKMGGENTLLTAQFKKESALVAPILNWNAATNLTVYVSYSATPKVSGEAAVKIVSVTGLPKGLKYNSGKVSGVPTVVKTYTVSVKVALKTNTKKTWTLKQKLVVGALPAWVKGGTYVGGGAEETLTNQVALTVGSTGKVSGKINFAGKVWTFTAGSYAALDAETGAIKATAVNGKTKKSIVINIGTDELGGWAVCETAGFAFEARQNLWRTDETWKTAAAALVGSVWTSDDLTVTFTVNGVVTAKLKDGANTFSASATLVPTRMQGEQVKGVLFVYFAPNTKKKFKGAVRVVDIE